MQIKNSLISVVCFSLIIIALSDNIKAQKPVFKDIPFSQDYSIKFYTTGEGANMQKVYTDRNGVIQMLSSNGLLKPNAGAFLYPGTIVADGSYRPMSDKQIVAMGVYDHQFVYLDSAVIFSNAWAGSLFSKHEMPNVRLFAGGADFTFLISDGSTLRCIKDSKLLWSAKMADPIIGIRYSAENKNFWILGSKSLSSFSLKDKKLVSIFEGANFTSFDLIDKGTKTIIGTNNGYFAINNVTRNQIGDKHQNLPCKEITCVEEINGQVWFGTTFGAFMLREDGKYNYYNGERWLPGDQVIQVTEGPDNSVLVLTSKGLGQICFRNMTLEDKIGRAHV